MSVNLSPIGDDAPFIDASGNPLNAGLLYTYTAGSTTPQNTYTTSAGSVANANPIVLDSNGYPSNGSSVVSIWLTGGVSYKFVLKTSAGVTVWTRDNISGINDTTVSVSEWVSGPAPTYVSATSFTLVGDQTSTFNVGRRLRTTNSGGTIYSRITVSAFAALTTVTVVNDSGVLDSGLSAVSYGLLSATNPSVPTINLTLGVITATSENLGDGTVALPAFAFTSDLDCGMYRIGANNIGLAVNGAKVLDIATTGLSIVGALSGTTTLIYGPTAIQSPGTLANINQISYAGTDGKWTCGIVSAGASGNLRGLSIFYPNATPNDTGNQFLFCADASASRLIGLANGGISNFSANNTNLSDIREKKSISLAGNYLDKICAIPVKTFLFNDQTDSDLNLGVIAQDVEAVAPELITESDWGVEGAPKIRKTIYETDLKYALMKAIQELAAKVAKLEAK